MVKHVGVSCERGRAALNEMLGLEHTASRTEQQRFMDAVIFRDLSDLRPAFDVAKIKHFWAEDFRVVIERCTRANIRVLGVEVFTPSGGLLDVVIAEDGTNDWCRALLSRYESRPALSFCATYDLRHRVNLIPLEIGKR